MEDSELAALSDTIYACIHRRVGREKSNKKVTSESETSSLPWRIEIKWNEFEFYGAVI